MTDGASPIFIPDTPGRLAIDLAVAALSVRERKDEQRVRELLRTENARIHSEFRIALAWALRRVLRSWVPQVKEIHLIGSSLKDDAKRLSDVDLIVRVPADDDVSRRLMDALNWDVTRAYASETGEVPAGFLLLDLHFVTDEDDMSGGGFASVIRGSNIERYSLLP